MTIRRYKQLVTIVMATVLVLWTAAPAAAQAVAADFDQLGALVKAGDTIYLTDSTGRDLTAKVAELSGTSLVVRARDSVTTFSPSDVSTIRLRRDDRLRDGALIGLAAGAFVGALAVAGGDYPILQLAGFGFFAGIGATVGLVVDASITAKEVVYMRSGVGRLSRLPADRRRGVQLAFRF